MKNKFKAVALKVLLFAIVVMSGVEGWAQVAAWDFTGVGTTSLPTYAATTFNANLVSTSGANNITRGAGAAWSGAGNSFRTTGFQNNGISTANTDYFQITLSAAATFKLSLSTIDARFDGTTTFKASPGVTSQFAYSLDGTTFTLIGTPVQTTSLIMTQIDLTGISALQNVASGTTVTIRYYASGQTTTGGWGFQSAATAGTNGLAIGGSVISAATPIIGISNSSPASTNVNQGALNVILQQYDVAVSAAATTLTALSVTTAGTYAAPDLTNLKLRYSTDNVLDAGDATLKTLTTGLGAGTIAFTGLTQAFPIATGYLFVTADIEPTATPGNTINIAATADVSNFTFSAGTPTGSTTVGGTKTIVAVTPNVALSSPTPAVPAGNILQNTNDNVVYRFDLAVTTANVTLDGVTINTSGTNTAADVDNFKCWYSADAVFNAGSDILLSTKTTFNGAGTHVFPAFTNQVITNGTTGYIFITASLPCAAVNGNTIIVDAITTADISFVSANKTGTANAGGTQTITTATPANVTGAAASNLNTSSAVSWTNPAGCYEEVLIVAATAANSGTPTGDGSAYTADLSFGAGTALGNGFVVYKGSSSPQTVTALTNGLTYHFKIFTRNNIVWSAGVEVTAVPSSPIVPGEIVINQFNPAYAGAGDEYVEIVNTTNKNLDLSTLQLRYQAASGSTTSSMGTLSGIVVPHGFWLLSPNATVNIGITSGIARDGSFSSGMAGTSGQIAIVNINTSTIIDAVGYGTITGAGDYTETAATSSPSSNSGSIRNIDGFDTNNNNSDFTSVSTANIYLRNSNSRLANTGAAIVAGTYTDISVTGNSSVAATTSVTNIVFASGANTLTLSGATTVSGTVSGSPASSLVINGNAGTLNFKQTTAATRSLNNMTLGAAGSAVLGSALDIYGTVGFSAGASLDMNAQAVTLKSTATATARVADLTGSTLTGASNATVERYINANVVGRKWHMLSGRSTVSSQTVLQSWQEGGGAPATANLGTWVTSDLYTGANGFDATSASSSILSHNPLIPSWVGAVATNTGSINDQQGYMLFVRGDRFANSGNALQAETVLRTTGTLRQGTQTAVTIPNANPGYTMVGNPFASPLDLENILTATNMGQFFYVWDASEAGNFGVGKFRLVQKTGAGTYTSTPTTGSDNTMRYIHSGQAFLLKTNGGGDAGFVAAEADKAGSLSIVNPLVPVPGDQQLYTELVTVNPGNIEAVADAVRVWYNAGFSAGTTDDALKIGNFKENLSSYRNGIKLIAEMRPMITATDTIFLRSGNLEVRDYRFKINTFDFVQTNRIAMLEDGWLNTSTPLDLGGAVTNINFSVTTDPASANADRFRIVFAAAGPLPVTITSIKAAQQGSQVAVEWKATNQVNMKQYEVEKSTDGINYTKVNTQAAVGASGSDATYIWMDVNPVTGSNFYRLRSVSVGGDVKISQVVIVKIGKGNPVITLYPNPVVNHVLGLQFADMEKGIYQVRLLNTAGQLLFTKTVNHAGGSAAQTIVLDSKIATGSYLLEIQKPDKTKTTTTVLITE